MRHTGCTVFPGSSDNRADSNNNWNTRIYSHVNTSVDANTCSYIYIHTSANENSYFNGNGDACGHPIITRAGE
jgi:hypothetical protein